MARHNQVSKLRDALMDCMPADEEVRLLGGLLTWGPETPSGQGFPTGAIFVNRGLDDHENAVFVNIGTAASATWRAVTVADS